MFFTIGHSNRTFEDFVAILKAHNIEILVDVRGGRAGSRTFPHFNKENLLVEIPNQSIDYLHISELGGRRPKYKDADPKINASWRVPAFRNYADYAYYNDSFKKGLEQLISLEHRQTAFMCSEAVPWRCHRSIIVDWLILTRNLPVTHILGVKQTMVGKPRENARLKNGSVLYP